MPRSRRFVFAAVTARVVGMLAALCVVAACSAPVTRHTPRVAATPFGTAVSGAIPNTGSNEIPSAEKAWAGQALTILQTANAGVQDYHQATELPPVSPQRRELQDRAIGEFRRAVADYQLLWPVTQQIPDAGVRDQFVFMMGNISGFLNPTPDLPGDPPSLGDRVAQSLENAIASGAAVRPKLERIAAQQ